MPESIQYLDKSESEELAVVGANSGEWMGLSEEESLVWSGMEFQFLGAATLNALECMPVLVVVSNEYA